MMLMPGLIDELREAGTAAEAFHILERAETELLDS